MNPSFLLDYLFDIRYSICLLGIGSLIYVWLARPKKEIKYLWIILIIGLFTQIRFGTLHNGFFLHAHDCIHYQIGSKYFKEFGYNGIYAGITQGLKELNQSIPSILPPKTFRDLDNKTGIHLNSTHPKTEEIKNRFTEQRWKQLKDDIMQWDKKYSPDWSHLVRDAGYNPPPAWTIWGLSMNQIVTPKNSILYGVPDIIILIIIFYLLWANIGPRPTLYPFAAMMFFPSGPYAPFDWIGGSLFRFLWVLWLTVGLIAYYKKQYRLAGFALALASLERIFPGAWLMSAGLISFFHLIHLRKSLGWKALEPLKGLTIGATIGLCSVMIVTHIVLDISTWSAFVSHIKEHGSYLFTNHFGWTRAITFHPKMGEMGFDAANMTIFNDWNEILLQRKTWVIYIFLRFSILIGLLYWAWLSIKKEYEPLAIGWLGASVVFFISMPAHYYLLGLLPILGITALQAPKMFLGVLLCMLIINVVTPMSETLSWSLASIVMASATAYGLGYTLPKKRKYSIALLASGLVVFLIMVYPTMLADTVKPHNKAEIIITKDIRRISRSFLVKEGYEVLDWGIIVPPNQQVGLRIKGYAPQKLHIRTDRYFKGTLVLKDSMKKEIESWDVQARGNMFDTLISKTLPSGEKDFLLEWKGKEKTDIGIFSIWTL